MAMTFDQYQKEVGRTQRSMHDGTVMKKVIFALGIAGEAGEVADLMKKHVGHGRDLDRMVIAKELGDVLWYVCALAVECGLDLDEVAAINMDKLRKRFPNGFTHEDANAKADEAPR